MIEINNKIIDSKELMNRVRKNVLNKQEIGNKNDVFSNNNLNISNLNKDIDSLYIDIQKMNETWQINDFTIRSHRKILGPFLVFGKRFVRKMLYWFIRPYWEQQINFNSATTRAISDMARVQSQLVDMFEIKDNGEV